MKILLDTHILLWGLYQPERLSQEALRVLSEPFADVSFSLVSLWEVQIKHARRPNLMTMGPRELYEECRAAELHYLALKPDHIFALDGLRWRRQGREHRDPFDRLLLAQAKREGMALVTHDRAFAGYEEGCVRLV